MEEVYEELERVFDVTVRHNLQGCKVSIDGVDYVDMVSDGHTWTFAEETRESRQRTCGNCKHYRFLNTRCQFDEGGTRDQDALCSNGEFRDSKEGG